MKWKGPRELLMTQIRLNLPHHVIECVGPAKLSASSRHVPQALLIPKQLEYLINESGAF
jgi:hypothetical protein